MADVAEPAVVQDAPTQVSYRFPMPVNVMAGMSLSVPIVQAEIPIARSAFYQPTVDARYPLASIELRNATSAMLPGGMVTMYESDGKTGNFVGDSQLTAVHPGDSRFLSFAIDQKVTVQAEQQQREDIKRISVDRGVVTTETVERRTTTFELRSAGTTNTNAIVELPRLVGWTLLPPTDPGVDVRQSGNRHRVTLPLGAAPVKSYSLVQERTASSKVDLGFLSINDLSSHLLRTEMDQPSKAILERLKNLREAKLAVEVKRDEADRARALVVAEQERLRENLKAAQGNAVLQQRYANSLAETENQLERASQEKKALEAAVVQAQSAIDAFLKK